MTVLWSLIGLISLVTAAVVIRATMRPAGDAESERAEFDLNVYKDQLAEVDRDVARGVLTEDQAAAARTEIERRILALADAAQPFDTGAAIPARLAPATLALALAVPAAALGLYLYLGAPMVPNVPFASRDIGAEQAAREDRQRAREMNQLAERLAERLKTEPDNIQGWMLLGRSYSALDRMDDAVNAMKRAYELAPLDADVIVQYAETRIIAAGNTVPAEAKALLERALGQDARNPRARYYLALAKAQAKDVRGALQGWIDLAVMSPAGAPWLASVHRQIAAAAKDLGIDPASIQPSAEALALRQTAAAPAIPGPTRGDVERAQQMSPQDRTEMIRGMVQRLADRLEENPDDPDGWQRLADAYRVLGEDKKAEKAEARAREAQQAAAPGPTREQVEAANQLSAGERGEMIRGMVERLADRLKENPDDLAGWRRLARAYRVLGEVKKAEEAEARIRALQN